MGGQVSLQLSQRREIQTTLHTYILLAFFVLQLVGPELAGVSKTSAAHSAAAGGGGERKALREKRHSPNREKQQAALQNAHLYGLTSLCCIMCLFRWLV